MGLNKYIENKNLFLIISSFYFLTIPLVAFALWKEFIISHYNPFRIRLILFLVGVTLVIANLFGDFGLESSSRHSSTVRGLIEGLDWFGGAIIQFFISFIFVFCFIALFKNGERT